MGIEASESSDETKQVKSAPAHYPSPTGEALRDVNLNHVNHQGQEKWRNARTTPRKPRTIPLLELISGVGGYHKFTVW